MIRLFNLFYGFLVKVGNLLQSPFLLAIRLFWGYQFFITGKGKLMNLEGVTSYFTELGLPMPKVQAILAGSTECFGGLLLLVGLFSRIISIPLIFTMVVAYLTADSEAVKGIFNDPDPFVTAKPFLFLLASVIVFVFGPGAFSLDRWILKRP
jgi:putative oxidoreductase